jgi:hypothetical protein
MSVNLVFLLVAQTILFEITLLHLDKRVTATIRCRCDSVILELVSMAQAFSRAATLQQL